MAESPGESPSHVSKNQPEQYRVEIVPDSGPSRGSPEDITALWLKEVGILLLGLFIGFFWFLYYREVSWEAHIIVGLLILILCLIRYTYLVLRRRN